MRRITDFYQQPLKWEQPDMFKNVYELRSREEQVATLNFRSMWGTLATAESADGCWTFKRVGFWQNKATVRVCGFDQDLAVFTNNTWTQGGTLEFAGGGAFKATTNFWMTNYEFQTDLGEPLVRFEYGGFFRLSAEVAILPAARTLEQLPVLVLFGWYLAINLHNDSGAAAAAVS
jgi:hypothetical protein